ncbi:MAG: aldehyde dehydrogenase family protein [Alistipes inops]
MRNSVRRPAQIGGRVVYRETAIVLAEIRDQLRHLERRARSRRVPTPLFLFPSASRIIREPQGVVLVMAPWNYPFQLALDPLVGALAAGNCVALKPSTTSARTCRLIGNILGEIFPGLRVGF